jgi:hypothetical protein
MPMTGYRLDDRCCTPITATTSRPLLGPTKTPVQRVPVVRSPRMNGSECEVSHSPLSGGDVRNSGAVPPLPHILYIYYVGLSTKAISVYSVF